jgi:xanthine dehydrogenase small subunit
MSQPFHLSCSVNGERVDALVDPAKTLLEVLREDCQLTGTKHGCELGECGACAVLVDGEPVLSCLALAVECGGRQVTTIEGVAAGGQLHPLQDAMADLGGSQCGYCTPGFVCSMAAEFYRAGRAATNGTGPQDHYHGENGFDLHAISGNLCRCTGYRPIKDAAFALGFPAPDDELAARRTSVAPAPSATRLHDGEAAFVRPADLAEALQLLHDHSDGEGAATVVAGSTDWGVDVNLKGARAGLVVAVDRLPELRNFAVTDTELRIGAALTLTEVERRLDGRLPLLAALMPQFASPLIRNSATLGGNLGTGSPIGDAPPVLLALEASVVLASVDGERTVPLADYFTGYRESVRRPGELIAEVVVPLPASRLTAFHKIAKRPFDDISSVAVGFAVDVSEGMVRKARIGLGGVAATPVRALATEAALEGRPWTRETVDAAAAVMAGEGTPISDQRSSADFRTAMLGQALRKLYAESSEREVRA